jgi:hypothetical protein
MIAVNLIPLARLRAGQRKRRVKGWSALSASVGVAAGLSLGAYRVASDAAIPDLRPAMESMDKRVLEAEAASESLGRELASVRAQLNANETAGKHPDWSVVLGLLARERGESVVLAGCELTPAKEPVKAAASRGGAAQENKSTDTRRWTHTLTVDGFATSTLEAQEYCLRLEASKVFDVVTPPETFAGEYEGRAATRFRFECRFAEREVSEGGTP